MSKSSFVNRKLATASLRTAVPYLWFGSADSNCVLEPLPLVHLDVATEGQGYRLGRHRHGGVDGFASLEPVRVINLQCIILSR